MLLDPCPSSPNCVSSQADATDTQHYLPALEFSGEASVVLDAVEAAIGADSSAKVTRRDATRLDAIYTSRLFRFKDDVTFIADAEAGKLHFRSASRMGHSDLGANRKRMTSLRSTIAASL